MAVRAVPYGGEDPVNTPRGSVEAWRRERGVRCWCGECNDLVLQGDRFLCRSHRKAG
jgi:hypothetical protein